MSSAPSSRDDAHRRPVSFEDAFPDAHAICSAFFTQPEANAKNWASLETLATADDKTFWTVVATHPKLPAVVDQLVRAVDESHATASKQHRVPRQQEKLLIQFLVRTMTSLSPSSIGNGHKKVSTSSVALRFSHLIPSSLLLPISLMLLRASGPIASTSMGAFLMQSPIALTHFTSVTSMWYDSVTQITTKCVHEAKRGRFQRRGGDILPLLERTYRLTKHMWALFNTAPYLVDYSDIRRVVVGLRIVTDVISPQLQHFIMVADELAPRRPQLTKANAMILNAAIGAATLATLFFTFANNAAATTAGSPSTASSASAAGRKRQSSAHGGGAPSCIGEVAMKQFEDSCAAFISQFCPGAPAALVERNRKLRDIFHAIEHPPSQSEGSTETSSSTGVRLALLFEWANGPIQNSNDFAAGLIDGEERLGPCLELELVHQGFDAERLLDLGFFTEKEAVSLGARRQRPEDASASAANHAITERHQTRTSASLEDAGDDVTCAPTGDPAVDIVLGVLPHFSANLARNALGYYNGDVEQLINDALCGNMPPHLQTEECATNVVGGREEAHRPQHLPAPAAASAARCYRDEVDDGLPETGDMERFVSSHFIDEGAAAEDDDVDEGGMLTTMNASSLSDALYVDDGFREHTFEFLYDDERDDANDGEAHVWGAVGGNNESSEDDEMDDALAPLNNHQHPVGGRQGGAAPEAPRHGGPGGRKPTDHPPKRSNPQGGGRGRGRGAGSAATAAEGGSAPQPAYKKTKEKKGGGGSKTALQRSIRRSGYE